MVSKLLDLPPPTSHCAKITYSGQADLRGGWLKRLRICLASWAPFWAGAEVAALRLAMGLRDAGYEVLVVVGTDGPALERMREAGLRCEFVPVRFTDKLRWWQYRQARQEWVSLLRREQPDLVHSNDLPTHQIVSDAARRLGVPRVCHHRWIFEGSAINWLNKYGAERHLFVSQYLMDELCGESSQLQASSRAVVHDGLPLPECPTEADRARLRKHLGLPHDRRIVLFAGQIIERKGVADLIRAWSLLSDEARSQAELVIVGDDLEGKGAYRTQMEALAAELRVAARFVGFQNNVGEWLTAADAVLVPSHTEPLGNATLEAMAYARPVVGCAVGGVPEMVVGEETGLLVSPRSPQQLASAIQRLIGNDEQREQFGRMARRRCEEKFSLATHVDAIVEQYRSVLAASREVVRR